MFEGEKWKEFSQFKNEKNEQATERIQGIWGQPFFLALSLSPVLQLNARFNQSSVWAWAQVSPWVQTLLLPSCLAQTQFFREAFNPPAKINTSLLSVFLWSRLSYSRLYLYDLFVY